MRILKRIFSYILSLIMLFSGATLVPPVDTTTDTSPHSFYMAVVTANQTVVEPILVQTTSDKTLREALSACEVSIQNLTDGNIYTVNGVRASYVRYYDGGGYDLDVPVTNVTTLLFCVDRPFVPSLLPLVRRMGEYRRMTNHVGNDPDARKAYENALTGLRTADNETANALLLALNRAIENYENKLSGTKYALSVQGDIWTEIRLTDTYGNETVTTTGKANLIAGSYHFVATDGKNRRTEGNTEIKGNTSLHIPVPTGDWFSEVRLLDSDKNAYPCAEKDGGLLVHIPDCKGGADVYLNARIGDVPDRQTTKLRAKYEGTDGVDKSGVPRSWNSTAVSLTDLLSEGMTGKAFCLEASFEDADGFTLYETYPIEVQRIPTLKSLTVTDDVNLLTGFDPLQNSFSLRSAADSVRLTAVPFGDYEVSVERVLPLSSGENTTTVSVRCGEVRNDYHITVQKTDAVFLSVSGADASGVYIRTQGGEKMVPGTENRFRLVPGEQYTLVVTDGVYSAERAVCISEDTTVSAPVPEKTDALESFVLYDRSSASTRKPFTPRTAFTGSVHENAYIVSDALSALYAQATPMEGYSVTAQYLSQTTVPSTNGKQTTVSLKNVVGTGAATYLSAAIARSGFSQTITIVLEKTVGDVTCKQSYTMRIHRKLHLATLSVEGMNLLGADGKPTSFDRDVLEYTLQIPEDETEILLHTQSMNADHATDICGGYLFQIGDAVFEETDIRVPTNSEELKILVLHQDAEAEQTEYILHFVRIQKVNVRFSVTPPDAIIFLQSVRDDNRVSATDGIYPLYPGEEYICTVTANGFVGQQIRFRSPEADWTKTIALQKAPERSFKLLPSAWSSTRADSDNNGVVPYKTPVNPSDAVLYWETKIGEGFSQGAPGCPILVDGFLYTYAGTKLYKIDCTTGKTVATSEMDRASSFAVNSPTYAEGMIFVGLSDGTVQAFNAETMESLWIYHDALGGQPNCPIVYRDGFVYTGFWHGETESANFVCLSVTDENPTFSNEIKLPTFTHTSVGGFYWAGAYVTDSAVIVGTDDGEPGCTTGHASLLSLDRRTGEVLDTLPMPFTGDIRCSVMHDDATDSLYFTSKGGYFCKVQMNADGTFAKESFVSLPLGTSGENAQNPSMSTSTPTVYNGRAYIGVSGKAQFGMYSGHRIAVIDLVHMEIAYTVEAQGFPQTSGMLTTAYEAEDGSVYVYFVDNYAPGKIRILRDKPGQTAPLLTVTETYEENGKTQTTQVAPALFTPFGEHAQYSIASPIADENGTIYFKNDSGYLYAVGSMVDKLTVKNLPDKLTYTEGERFDGAGLKVTATFRNGRTADVTSFIEWSDAPLTAEDAEFILRFPYLRYHDGEYGAGTQVPPSITSVSLEILPRMQEMLGDVDEDGQITLLDGDLLYRFYNGETELSEKQLAISDVNADGKINALDVALIYAVANGKRADFTTTE